MKIIQEGTYDRRGECSVCSCVFVFHKSQFRSATETERGVGVRCPGCSSWAPHESTRCISDWSRL